MLQAIIEDITVTAREAAGSEIERQGQIPDAQAHPEAALRPEQYQIGADRGSEARDAAGKLAHTQRTIGDTVDTLLAKKDAMTPERLKLLLSVVQLDREVSAATGSASSLSPGQKEAMQARLGREAERYPDLQSKQAFLRASQLIA
jgi:hypothetical protein